MAFKVIIMGAAGRDFHNFNTFFRNNKSYKVVAFTATQIPNIEGRVYPASLAGKGYPKGIPIEPENKLTELIKQHEADFVVFSYSDVSHEYVMHKASEAQAAGATFWVMGTKHTMIESSRPVIAICAVRTGSGKSQTTRKVSQILKDAGKKVVVIRHPMPYGDLEKQKVQRFASYKDLEDQKCTIEEREEYEPHIARGTIVYAGVDYEAIIRQAEEEADVVLWDGGNNDLPFYQTALHIVVADPHRAGHEKRYFPGEANVRRADVIIINKVDTAKKEDIEIVKKNIAELNPNAKVIMANSPFTVDKSEQIKGKKVLVIEDGPTLTHGEMKYGAGIFAAKKFGAAEIVDPRPYTVGTITDTFKKYPEIGTLLPAMGYSDQQIKDMETTINKTVCDLVVSATPIDISKLVKVNKTIIRVGYELEEVGSPNLKELLTQFTKK
jgi:predicted GTPase